MTEGVASRIKDLKIDEKMKEYILTSINNRLLKNKRTESLYDLLKGFEQFYFTDKGLEEFLNWLDISVSNLNREYLRMKPLSLSSHSGGYAGMLWVTIMPDGAHTENQLTLGFTSIVGHWEMPSLFKDE